MSQCLTCQETFLEEHPDHVFCSPCQSELLGWLGGYARAPDGMAVNLAFKNVSPDELLACYLCGQPIRKYHGAETGALDELNVEHAIPLSKGGGDRLPNIGLACLSCNATKGNRPLGANPKQQERLQAQQSAFAQRYAEMKPYLQQSFLQQATLNVWESHGFDEDGFEPGDLLAVDAAEDIVEGAGDSSWWSTEFPADGSTEGVQFTAFCLDYGVPSMRSYRDRDFFDDPVTDDQAADLLREALRAAQRSWSSLSRDVK